MSRNENRLIRRVRRGQDVGSDRGNERNVAEPVLYGLRTAVRGGCIGELEACARDFLVSGLLGTGEQASSRAGGGGGVDAELLSQREMVDTLLERSAEAKGVRVEEEVCVIPQQPAVFDQF